MPVGTVEDRLAHVLDILCGGKPDCQLGQLGRGGGCSSCVHILCRLLDDGGNLAARLGRGKRKMPRSFLSARHARGEAGVKRASLGQRGARDHSGTHERMGEAETIPLDFQDPRLERVGQSGLRPPADGRLDEAHRRIGQQGDDARNLDCGSPEAIEALLN